MDKAPDLGLPFFYRVILPGSFLTVVTLPIIGPILTSLSIVGKDQTPYLIGIGIGLGFIVSLLDTPIYQILEGRRGWPKWLSQLRMQRWSELVRKQYAIQDSLAEDDPRYGECWYLLRQFPVGPDGNPTVTMPSRIGNVIAAYEQYPELRYGMDSVFYWPRLWLVLEKDVRDEIDNPWAGVDAVLYSGFGAGVVGVLYLLIAAITGAAWALGYSALTAAVPIFWLAISIAMFVVYFACLRIAVPSLVRIGENFKGAFDLYRSKLHLEPPTTAETQRWEQLSTTLQYGKQETKAK
jgi:hypothetical protein